MYSVVYATSLEEAVRKFESWRIGIVLCDIELPDGSGLDFLEWVQEKHPKTVSMIMTCHEEFDYAKRAVALGCKDYIVNQIVYEEQEEKLSGTRQETQAFTGNKADLVGQVKAYITANLKEELRVEMLAKQFYISADYLSKVFKKEEGIGIGDYIVEERMFLARELMREGRSSVSRIAYECGYDNYSYFTKVFKKKYGVTPREYMQEEV